MTARDVSRIGVRMRAWPMTFLLTNLLFYAYNGGKRRYQ